VRGVCVCVCVRVRACVRVCVCVCVYVCAVDACVVNTCLMYTGGGLGGRHEGLVMTAVNSFMCIFVHHSQDSKHAQTERRSGDRTHVLS